ncbi:hypothetical protein FQR65_LT09041 [Abscondita terminalis]|nr:hypothetical protein FQR65_LT09041 [Abscondita terminalis]
MKVKIGIIGGSGLDNPDILKNRTEKKVTTVFGDPSDILIEGEIEGVPCILLARHGRQHSIMPGNVNYRANIWALKEEGCSHVIVSTATGSLQEHIQRGDFRSREIIIKSARELGLSFHPTGTVVAIEGPRFSSKAESLMFRQWGGHVINMTTVPEASLECCLILLWVIMFLQVVLAKEAGLCYAAIALATDYDCWKASGERVCVEDVMTTFKQSVPKMIELITKVVPQIALENWDDTINELKDVARSSVMLPS